MADPLMIERDGVVTTLVLNRPEKRNALSAELVEAMIAAISVARDDGTRLLVVRGAGAGFSGGFDFGNLERHSDGDLALRAKAWLSIGYVRFFEGGVPLVGQHRQPMGRALHGMRGGRVACAVVLIGLHDGSVSQSNTMCARSCA